MRILTVNSALLYILYSRCFQGVFVVLVNCPIRGETAPHLISCPTIATRVQSTVFFRCLRHQGRRSNTG
jgi:hypothetical protein